MKMQERMKMRSVSFSDEAPAPVLPPRTHRSNATGTYRRQTSSESLPMYETDPIYGNIDNYHHRDNHMNSFPRIMPHSRRKLLDFGQRPSSSLAGLIQKCFSFQKLFIFVLKWSKIGKKRSNNIKEDNWFVAVNNGFVQKLTLLPKNAQK